MGLSIDALSWPSPTLSLACFFKFGHIPLQKGAYMKQNLLQPFSSITFTQHLGMCCLEEEAWFAPRQAIHSSFPSVTESDHTQYLLESLKRQKSLLTRRRADLILRTLEGLLRNRGIGQLAVVTCRSMKAAQRCAFTVSLVSYCSGSKYTIKLHTCHKGRQD